MNKEDKELLLKYLCMALPYMVKIEITWWVVDAGYSMNTTLEPDHIEQLLNDEDGDTEIKPFLRPMSSMTDEEVKEFYDVECMDAKVGYIKPNRNWHFTVNGIDWLLKNHFDYRGLIEKGLAIEVTKENNPYENGL